MLTTLNKIEYWIGKLDVNVFTLYLSVIAATIISFLMPIYQFILITVALITFDYLTGVKAAVKKGETPNSKGYRRTAEKGFIYMGLILVLQGVKVVFFDPIGTIPFIEEIPITYAGAAIIVRAELKSISENVNVLTNVNIWTYISKYFKTNNNEQSNNRPN